MRRLFKRVAVGVAVVLTLGVSGMMCSRVQERGRYVGAYSTYGAGPEGTRGLYLLAEELGARPQRWAEDLGRLPERGMLVALGSCQQLMRREIGRIERENLQAWVEGGGTLVVAGVPDYLSREGFGVELLTRAGECRPSEGLIAMFERADARSRQRKRETDDDATEFEDLPAGLRDDFAGTYDEMLEQGELPEARVALGTEPPLSQVPLVGMRGPLSIRVSDDRTRSTILRLDGPDGDAAGVRVDVGEGAVIVLASSSMFQNRDLATQSGGVLFSRLVRHHAPDGPVLFDEFHLGVGQRRSLMRYLRQTGAAPVVLQILLLIGLVLWRFGARFGAISTDPPAQPRGTASYVSGVGTLYAKAQDPDGALGIIVRRALTRIALHHHLVNRDSASLADALEARNRSHAARAVREIEETSGRSVGRGKLTKLVARIDELTKVATA